MQTLFLSWLPFAPSLGHPPPLPVHRPPKPPGWEKYQVFVWIWTTAALAGLRAGRKSWNDVKWGREDSFYWASLCTLPSSSSGTTGILFFPPPATSEEISPLLIFRGWGRSPFSSPLGMSSLDLCKLVPHLVLSEGRHIKGEDTD